MLNFTIEDPASAEAGQMMQELSQRLYLLTGSCGDIALQELRQMRARFVIARDDSGAALACGAIRPLPGNYAELKRMYVRQTRSGVGAAVLAYLESEARRLGFHTICLSTRAINQNAVNFYLRHAYQRMPNYGLYAGRSESLCFKKVLR